MKYNGYKGNKIFSWVLLWRHGIIKDLKKIFTQKWWTYKQWSKVRKNAVCPKCNTKNFDID